MLRVLDYSRSSRHLLATAGDDGSVHLWDTTGRNPKVSWSKQHSAPTVGVCFSPTNDKVIASVGMDKKLYTFDSGIKKHTAFIPYDVPFSSLSFSDDGWILAAGTSKGRVVFYDVRGKLQPFTVLRAYSNMEAVTSLCWQRLNPIVVNESTCTAEIALLGGSVEDSILMPDPLPSSSLSHGAAVAAHLNLGRTSYSETPFSSSVGSGAATPQRNSLWSGGALARLHPTRNFKDDMEVFSPLVDVLPITPSFDKFWNEKDGRTRESSIDRKPLLVSSGRIFPLSEEGVNEVHSIFDWKFTSTSKQDDIPSFPQAAPFKADDSVSMTSPEAGAGDKMADKFVLNRPLGSLPSRRLSTYADRISTVSSFNDGTSALLGSPIIKKTEAKTREEPLNNLLLRRDTSSANESGLLPSTNGAISHPQGTEPQGDSEQGSSSFTLQLFQRTLEETLASFQNTIHEDVRNLHIEILRQFHMQEIETSTALNEVLKNQAELMKEMQALREENQRLRQML